ncbi:MAG: hypothetical protein E7382_00015 [Clostridiales bacterium]|nr:hypothetical protein [Clostridiales bacterium]
MKKTTVRDKLWLWGQSPDCHWETNNRYNLPGHSRMTAVEGCYYFDIPNICRVKMMGKPEAPYDQDSEAMRPCKQVVWSLLGAGGEPVTEWGDLEEVVRQSKMYDNITGGVFDDFFLPHRIAHFTPEKLLEVKKKMCDDAGRNLDMWVVFYEQKFDTPNLKDYLNAFDVITNWTWCGSNIKDVRKNLDALREMAPTKRIMAGCYMWNYGEAKPLTIEEMQAQCDVYLEYLKKGYIDGIIVCSNCIADLDIEAVRWMRNWINEHKDEVIEG